MRPIAAKKPPFKKHPLTIAIQACAYTILGASPLAVAAPTGGAVVGGSGTISQSGTTTTINQATQNLAINWNTFNVAVDERVQFIQPNASAIALNTILSNDGTTIAGRIDSNGQVILVNANGIFFTATSVLNVGSIIASGLSINPAAFMNGNYVFNEIPGSSGVVINSGTINASLGGNVALIGKRVENNGLIVANLGTVTLAAGKQAVLTFDSGGLLGVRVSQEILQSELGIDPAVLNSGEIQAQGGRVLLTASQSQDVFSRAVNNAGMEPATSVVMNDDGSFTLGGADVLNSGSINTSATAAGQSGGRIVMIGENVTSSGTLRADAASGNGGEIELHANNMTLLTGNSITSARSESNGNGGIVKVLGDKVGLFDQSTVDVSGANGGGQALIGGDYQGTNANIRNSSATIINPGASVYADALQNGNGGKVIAWSDGSTYFLGNISVKGGSISGNGGFVETSGKEFLRFDGYVDRTAANGASGMLLLDPKNITIQAATGNADGNLSDREVRFNEGSSDGDNSESTISATALVAALTGGNVTLQANNDITFSAAVLSASANGLTLEAGRSIFINSAITLTGGFFMATINDSGADTGSPGGTGAIPYRTAGPAVFSMGAGSSITTNGGNITIGTGGFVASDSARNTLIENIGNITLQTLNSSGLNAASSPSNPGATGGNAGIINVTNAYGDISVNGQITALGGAGGSSTFVDVAGVGATGGSGGAGGKIALEATRGSITTGAAILSNGGAGGAGTDVLTSTGGNGGIGGTAGTINLTVGTDLVVNANIAATGGAGGLGGLGDVLNGGGVDGTPGIAGNSSAITLIGSSADNIFTLNDVTLTGSTVTIAGGSGDDQLVRTGLLNNTWTVGGANSGTLAFGANFGARAINFSGMESLIGSAAQDTFDIMGAGSLTGLMDGGGGASDALTFRASDVILRLSNTLTHADAVADTALNVARIESITAGGISSGNTILGENVATTWTINGTNSGIIAPTAGGIPENTVSFQNIGTLTGGNQTDTFNVTGGTIGTLNGGAGVVTDIFNVTGGYATAMNGGDGNDSFTIVAAAGGATTLDGGAGTNTLAFNGTTGNDSIALGASTLSSGGFTLNYSSLNDITIDTLAGIDSVALSSVLLTGNLRLANTETVTGTGTSLTAATLILDNVGQFGTAGALIGTTIGTLNLIGPASQIYINESNGLSVNMTAAGVNSASVFQVGGLTSIDAGGSALVLNNGANDFDTVNIINATSITLSDQNAILGGTMNVGTGSITLNAAAGIGTVSALNTTAANLTVTNTLGAVNISNTGPVSASVITAGNAITAGNINFTNNGTLTIRQLNTFGGLTPAYDASSYGGAINLTVTNGAVYGTNYVPQSPFPIPDIVAQTFVGSSADGDFGAAGMLMNVMVKERFDLTAIGRRAYIQFIPTRPAGTILADLTLSINALGGIDTRLLEIDSLDEFDPAIFTDIRNYYYEDVAIMMPADQRLDATDEEEKKNEKEQKL